MATKNTLQIRRGSNLSNAGTPAVGELIYKTDTKELYIGDGSTVASSLTPIGGTVNLASQVTGTLSIANGGTGAATLNDLIELGTHTTGSYVQSISEGTGISIK